MAYKSLMCENCGHTMTIETVRDDFHTLSCPVCSSKQLIEESDAVMTARIQAKIQEKALDNELYKEQMRQKEVQHDNKVIHRMELGLLIFIIACFIILGIMASIEIESQWDDENLKGLPYQVTAQILKDAGFKNIECIPMNDLDSYFFLTRNGYVDKVDKVSIGGKTDFHKKGVFQQPDTFHKNDQVTIWYHSYAQSEDQSEEMLIEEIPSE